RSARSRKRHCGNEKQSWIVVHGSHEPLVDRETWQTAQERRDANRAATFPIPNGGEFLFTPLGFCGHCGSPLHGCTNVQKHRRRDRSIASKKTYTYRRYICGKYNAHGKQACKCNTIPEKHLLNVVIRKIQQDFLAPKNLERLRAEIKRQLQSKHTPDSTMIDSVRLRIAELDRQIGTGTERLLTAPSDLIDM